MEEHEEAAPILRTEQRLQVETPKHSEEINDAPLPLQLFCNPVCAFSTQESAIEDSEQRSKSAVKLCGLISFYIIVMAVEVVGGLKANSLAVLTDAAHLLTDIAGFAISLFAIWASGWQATSRQSFGFNRLEVLGALVSVQLIWLVSGFLICEAVNRILHQNARVNGKLMFAIAAFGCMINFIMVIWLGHGHGHGHCHDHHDHGHGHVQVHSHGHDHSRHACRDKDHDHKGEELCAMNEEEGTDLVSAVPETTRALNINLQGAYLHVITDLIQSIGVMIAGCIIWIEPDWLMADLVCTLIFSVLSLSTTLPMLKSIFCILMERTPSDIDITGLEDGLRCIDGVHDIHDLHVWSITAGKIVLACHVTAEPCANSNDILHKIKNYCEKIHKIYHVTIQIEQGYSKKL